MRRYKLQLILFTVVLLLLITAIGCSNQTQSSGYQVYKSYCFGCHSINGEGGKVGPDLSKIGSYRDKNWLAAWIKNPKSIKPNSRMPVLNLSDKQINDVSQYLVSLK